MVGRVPREPTSLNPPDVHIELATEQDAPAADVGVMLARGGGVPELAGHLAICGRQEQFTLVFVLANEETNGGSPSA
jgi:hypothetical protein